MAAKYDRVTAEARATKEKTEQETESRGSFNRLVAENLNVRYRPILEKMDVLVQKADEQKQAVKGLGVADA